MPSYYNSTHLQGTRRGEMERVCREDRKRSLPAAIPGENRLMESWTIVEGAESGAIAESRIQRSLQNKNKNKNQESKSAIKLGLNVPSERLCEDWEETEERIHRNELDAPEVKCKDLLHRGCCIQSWSTPCNGRYATTRPRLSC